MAHDVSYNEVEAQVLQFAVVHWLHDLSEVQPNSHPLGQASHVPGDRSTQYYELLQF